MDCRGIQKMKGIWTTRVRCNIQIPATGMKRVKKNKKSDYSVRWCLNHRWLVLGSYIHQNVSKLDNPTTFCQYPAYGNEAVRPSQIPYQKTTKIPCTSFLPAHRLEPKIAALTPPWLNRMWDYRFYSLGRQESVVHASHQNRDHDKQVKQVASASPNK